MMRGALGMFSAETRVRFHSRVMNFKQFTFTAMDSTFNCFSELSVSL